MKNIIFIYVLIFSFSSYGFDWRNCQKERPLNQNDQEKLQNLQEKIVEKLPQNRTFYHWASWSGFNGLQDKVAQLNSKEFQKNCRVKLSWSLSRPYLSGHGLYMAANPYSSSQFAYDEKGYLFEITVSQGAPYLDIFTMPEPRYLSDLYKYPVNAIISTRNGNVNEKHGWWVNKLTDENSYQVKAVNIFNLDNNTFAHILFSLAGRDFETGNPYLIDGGHDFVFPRVKKQWDQFISQQANQMKDGQVQFAGFGLCALKENGKIFLTLLSECIKVFENELVADVKNIPKGSDILTFSHKGLIVAGGRAPENLKSYPQSTKQLLYVIQKTDGKPVLLDGLAPFSKSLKESIIVSAANIKKMYAMFNEKRDLKTIEMAEKLQR